MQLFILIFLLLCQFIFGRSLCFWLFFIRLFHSSPQEASGRGPVGTEPDTSPSQFCCFISSCGIISADALLSSHCVETLVLCQTVGQGALNRNIHQRRREITGIALSHTHVHTFVYYYVVIKGVNLISFRRFISAFFLSLYMICPVFVLAFFFLLYCNPVRLTRTLPSNRNNNNCVVKTMTNIEKHLSTMIVCF